MPTIKVVTDSTCDIPESLLKQFDVTVVPFSIEWGAESYLDKVNLQTPDYLKRLETSDEKPTVLSPSVDEFSRVFRSLRDSCDGVVSIHLSGRMSDAVTNAATAREAFGPVGHGGPFPIAVVDSQSVSMGLGWLVLAVARAAQAGLELTKLANMAVRLRGQTHVAFITDTVDSLLASGAAPNLAQQASQLQQLKPLFHLEEGQILVYERTRTRPKARDSLYNFVEDFPKIGEMAVLNTGGPNDLDYLLTRVGAIYPRERVVMVQPGPALTSMLCPDALGVAVFE
jgi:DegV family protein with EDD domain